MNNKFDKTQVKELTNKDYKIEADKVIIKGNKQKGLVVFYYYWCGYCNMIAPDLIKLANKKDVSVYAIHGENPKNKKVFQKLEIQGVPHIRLVKSNGVISDIFQGNRTTEDFYKFIKTQKGGCSTYGGKNKLKTKGYKKQKVKEASTLDVKYSGPKPKKSQKKSPKKSSKKSPKKSSKKSPKKSSKKSSNQSYFFDFLSQIGL